jgi:release factor glutamine methyltransferase
LAGQAATSSDVTIRTLIRYAVQRLTAAGIDRPEREAVWLLEQALGMPSLALLLNGSQPVAAEPLQRAHALLDRRAAREPLQYLLGTQEFYGLEFEVNPAVLIPRPETELLVEVAQRCLEQESGAGWRPVVADVGTGSGCIAVALARQIPAAALYALDCSPEALMVARRNALRHGVVEQVTVLEGDLLAPLEAEGLAGQVDLIVSNPPYIAERNWETLPPEVRLFEPRVALAGGEDGLAVYRRLIPAAAEFLRVGGWLIVEIGQGQEDAVCQLIERTGQYGNVMVRPDHAGIARVVYVRRER